MIYLAATSCLTSKNKILTLSLQYQLLVVLKAALESEVALEKPFAAIVQISVHCEATGSRV